MAKRNRNKGERGFWGGNFWQSAAYNQRVFLYYRNWILSLAMNRFKWLNMPDTCDPRFLEWALQCNGVATIAQFDEKWLTLQAVTNGELSMYGIPTTWRALGQTGETQFDCSPKNGVLVYNSQSRSNVFTMAELMARKLAHYEKTENVNLTQIQNPTIWAVPQEMKQDAINLLRQTTGGEPIVLANPVLLENLNVQALTSGKDVQFIADKLYPGKQNAWSEIYRFLGIDHLAFEKNERMIEQEAEANNKPTQIKLMDEMEARREALEYLQRNWPETWGNVQVVINEDIESYNWAATERVEESEESTDELA